MNATTPGRDQDGRRQPPAEAESRRASPPLRGELVVVDGQELAQQQEDADADDDRHRQGPAA